MAEKKKAPAARPAKSTAAAGKKVGRKPDRCEKAGSLGSEACREEARCEGAPGR